MSNQVFSNDIQMYSIDVPNIKCDSIQFGNGSLFQSYLQSGFSATVTGPISSGAGALYRKLDRVFVFSCGGIVGTSTSATPFTFTNLLPKGPFATMIYTIWIKDNGVDSIGTLKIETSGQMTIYKNLSDSFSATGICGFQPFTIAFSCFE